MSTRPFLKWAGGKRWLVDNYGEIFNVNFDRYIEPFLGSGSVFFHLTPEKAILSDKNGDLINVYQALRDDWFKVFVRLIEHHKNHSHDYYYKQRLLTYKNRFSRAAQFIYLNRTCWNGLYRVSTKGKFNVPKGTKKKVILSTDDFEGIAEILKNAELKSDDFEHVISKAGKGDLLFLDPPYTANHNKNGFVKYNESIFRWKDQLRLSECVKDARNRGAHIILTNADHKSIRDLYDGYFIIRSITRQSLLSGRSQYRGKVSELLVIG